MSKISNKELAEILTEKHGLSKQDAEKFVSKMFDVIEEGLQSDKQVKVKGLGTFKVVSVASRKSVDVNTGEPIVIEGRDKINFTPDTSMRDAVNRPFSQFDTVVLNNGVDFSEIDKKYEESEKEDVEEDTVETPIAANDEQQKEEPQKEEQPSIIAEQQKEETSEKGAGQPVNVVEQQTVVVEPKEAETPIFVEEPKKENNVVEEPKEEGSIVEEKEPQEQAPLEPVKEEETPTNDSADKVEEEIKEEEKVEEEKEEEIKEEKKVEEDVEAKIQSAQHRTLKYVCIAAAIIIVLLGASAFYLFNQLQLRDNRIENLEAQVLEKKHKKTTPKKSTTVIPASNTQEIVSTDGKLNEQSTNEDVSAEQLKPNTTTEPTLKKSSVNEKKVLDKKGAVDKKADNEATASNENNASNNYSKDVRIRTGAYNIVGVDHTITVKAGQTLSSISRSQLGPGMECYIEAVNGGKTEFKAGEKVKVPKLKLKKRK